MEEKEKDFITDKLLKVNLYCLIKDVLRNIWVVLLCAIMCGMIGNMYGNYLTTNGNSYTTSATLIVTTKGSSNYAYSNLSSASTTANTLTSIMNSQVMLNYIRQEMDLTDLTGVTANASVISDTNLVTLTVTAESAEMAFRVIHAIMDNYSSLTASSLGNVILEVFKEPTVPTGSNQSMSVAAMQMRYAEYGALLGLLLVCFFSIMNDTIKNGDDMTEKLDAKSLGIVFHERKIKSLSQLFEKKKSSILVTNTTTSFAFVESYRKIAAKITYLKKKGTGLNIMITSVLENEGKSTAATNLAITLTDGGKKVLLIDCDFRKPAQSLILNDLKTPETGLSNYLTGKLDRKDLIRYDEKRGIYTIFTRKAGSVATELISCAEMENLIHQVKNEFDYIILDTPPLSSGVDAEVLADLVDVTVLVVRFDQLQARDVNDAIDLLDSCRSELAGVVLNQARTMRGTIFGETGSGYGYGYGYGYGKYGHYGHYGHYGQYGHYHRTIKNDQSAGAAGNGTTAENTAPISAPPVDVPSVDAPSINEATAEDERR